MWVVSSGALYHMGGRPWCVPTPSDEQQQQHAPLFLYGTLGDPCPHIEINRYCCALTAVLYRHGPLATGGVPHIDTQIVCGAHALVAATTTIAQIVLFPVACVYCWCLFVLHVPPLYVNSLAGACRCPARH